MSIQKLDHFTKDRCNSNNSKLKYSHVISILLHATLLTLCVLFSVFFIQEWSLSLFKQEETFNYQWSYQNLINGLKKLFNLITGKLFMPAFIFTYILWIIKNKVYLNLFKDQYSHQYDYKYKKVHKIIKNQIYIEKNIKCVKRQDQTEEFKIGQLSNMQQKQIQNINKQNNQSFESSSLNKSIEMVKSMSRSMLGSLKSISNMKNNNNSAVFDVNDLHIKTNKIIQNISKKNISNFKGKNLIQIFQKDKISSQSGFLNSSNISSAEEIKVRIKNKKYYDILSQSQNNQYQKWYQQKSLKFIQTIKNQNFQKLIIDQNILLRLGLYKQLYNFMKKNSENNQNMLKFLTKYYQIKITGNDDRNNNGSYELKQLFNKDNKRQQNILVSLFKDQKQVSLKKANQMIKNPHKLYDLLQKMKIKLRKQFLKGQAQKQIQILLKQRQKINILLNVSIFSGQYDILIDKNIRFLQKGLKILQILKNNIKSLNIFSNFNSLFINEMEILQSIQLDNIRQMVAVRVSLLNYFVNKINLLTPNNSLKIKMKEAITYDSGYLTQIIDTFKPSYFAQIKCIKSYDNIIPHYDLIIFTQFDQRKQVIYNCQPGINNPFSIILILCKKIQQNMEHIMNTNSDQFKKQQLKKFIDQLYPVTRP